MTIPDDELAAMVLEHGIRRLLADYAESVTRMDAEAMRRLFLPDGRWDVRGMGSRQGHDELVAFLGGLLRQWDGIVHCVHSGRVRADGAAEAVGRWIVSEHGTKGGVEVRYSGVYQDRYRRGDDGDWRFGHRRYAGMFVGVGDDVLVRPWPGELGVEL